jgi:OmpA-OmpF porin, OOP family
MGGRGFGGFGGRLAALATVCLIATAGGAEAQVPRPGIVRDDAQLFLPATDPSRFVQIYDTRNLEPGRFTLGLYGNYAENPIQLRLEGIDEDAGDVVKRVWGANLLAAIGVTERFQLGIDIPYVHTKVAPLLDGATPLDDDGATLGDIRVEGKLTLIPRPVGEGFGLSIVPRFVAPTGDLDKFAGTGEIGGGGLVVADARYRKINFALNVGGLIRDGFGAADDDDKLDDQLLYGAGVTVPTTRWLDVIGEVNGRSAFSNQRTNPVEGLLSFRFHWGDYALTIGGGIGLNHSRGAPDFRVLAGITPYIPEKEPPPPMADLVTNSAKSWTLAEDTNGDGRPNPGETIEYEITLVNTGTKVAEEVVFVDPIPELTTYVPGSMMLRGAPVTDEADGDGADFDATNARAVTVNVGTISNEPESESSSASFSFRVTIDPEVLDLTVIRNEATVYHRDQPAAEGTDPDTGPRAGETIRAAETTVFPSIRERETVVVTPDRLELTKNIHFEFNKAIIRTESHAILNDVAEVMNENPQLNILVEGHTDSIGSADYNQRLSERRAAAVKEYLVSRGVSGARLETSGKGELAPIATNDTAVGRAINRRVEFLIVNPEVLRGKRIEKQNYIDDIAPESEPPGLESRAGSGARAPVGDEAESGGFGGSSPASSPDRVVLDAQRTLANLGYYRGPATGIVDPKTAEAIRRFQSENGLPNTGVPDATTRRALDEALQLHRER